MGASVVWSYLDLFGNKHLAGHVSVDQSPRQYYDETWRWGQPGCCDAESPVVLTVRLEYDAGGVARGLVPACFGDTYRPTSEEVESLAREIDKCPPKIRAEIMADHTHLDFARSFPADQAAGSGVRRSSVEGVSVAGKRVCRRTYPRRKDRFLRRAGEVQSIGS